MPERWPDNLDCASLLSKRLANIINQIGVLVSVFPGFREEPKKWLPVKADSRFSEAPVSLPF
ncbi:hypothetical protein D3C85_1574060 [compost metagenome]|jgi:hypothetical protein